VIVAEKEANDISDVRLRIPNVSVYPNTKNNAYPGPMLYRVYVRLKVRNHARAVYACRVDIVDTKQGKREANEEKSKNRMERGEVQQYNGM
jgi:hypothetical protein